MTIITLWFEFPIDISHFPSLMIYLFGSVAMVTVTTVINTFYQLNCEDHKWFWSSFINSGYIDFSEKIPKLIEFRLFALYLFIYNVYINFNVMTTSLFFTLLVSCCYLFFLFGSQGFIWSYLLIKKLYSSLMID